MTASAEPMSLTHPPGTAGRAPVASDQFLFARQHDFDAKRHLRDFVRHALCDDLSQLRAEQFASHAASASWVIVSMKENDLERIPADPALFDPFGSVVRDDVSRSVEWIE